MNNLMLNSINWTTVGIVIAIVAVIAVVFAILIVTVSKLCTVKEDERVGKITENLAGANCGGCGFAGCADFAKAIVEGKADISMCGATGNEGKAKIAEIMGVTFSKSEPTFAVVKCNGGINCNDKYQFVGNADCVAQINYMGGKKQCPDGCLGGGSCVAVCKYGALGLNDGVAKVDKSLCESCGACVRKCPKHIIEFIPKSAKVYIACSTHCKGKEAMGNCKASCIACGMCVRTCPQQAIEMVDNIPVIDYKKCTGCKTCVLKCPRKCIKEL